MFSPMFVLTYLIVAVIGYTSLVDLSGNQPSGYYMLTGAVVMLAAFILYTFGAIFIRFTGNLHERVRLWQLKMTEFRLTKISWKVKFNEQYREQCEYLVESRVKFPFTWGRWKQHFSSTRDTLEEGTELLEYAKKNNCDNIEITRRVLTPRTKTVVVTGK